MGPELTELKLKLLLFRSENGGVDDRRIVTEFYRVFFFEIEQLLRVERANCGIFTLDPTSDFAKVTRLASRADR